MAYTRNLSGDCERDLALGIHHTIQDCLADNRRPIYPSSFDRYIVIESATYDKDAFIQLAPSERSEYLRIRYGLDIRPQDSAIVGGAINTNNYTYLYNNHYHETLPYLQTQLDDYDFYLLDLLKIVSALIDELSTIFNLAQFRNNINTELYTMSEEVTPDAVHKTIMDALFNQNVSDLHADAQLALYDFIEEHWDVFNAKYNL